MYMNLSNSNYLLSFYFMQGTGLGATVSSKMYENMEPLLSKSLQLNK